jgi:hypothetical protein
MNEINLKKLSATLIAARIWGNPIIGSRIWDFYLPDQKKELENGEHTVKEPASPQNFQSITNLVVLQLHSLELPLQLEIHCENVIRELGKQIHDWTEFVTKILKFDLKFALEIYWLPSGIMDEEKIFKSWESDQKFLNQENSRVPALYVLACIDFRADFFFTHKTELEELIRANIKPTFQLSDYDDSDYTLIVLFLNILIFNNFGDHNGDMTFFVPLYMFLKCLCTGLTKAAFYIYDNFIKEGITEEDNLIINLTSVSVRYISDNCLLQISKANKGIFFLISQMTAEQRSTFFQENVAVLFCQILIEEPFHELIIELINNYFSNLLVIDFQEIFSVILNQIKYYETVSWKSKVEGYCVLFRQVFARLPENFKNEIFMIFDFRDIRENFILI